MPLFDFKCVNEECSHEFEDSLSLAEVEDGQTTVVCPKCQGTAERLITNPRHYKHFSWSSWQVSEKARS